MVRDNQLGFLVKVRGLHGIEGFPVELRFDPDPPGQTAVSAAVSGREGESLPSRAADSLEPGVAGVVHAASLPAARRPALSDRAHGKFSDFRRLIPRVWPRVGSHGLTPARPAPHAHCGVSLGLWTESHGLKTAS